MPSRSPSPGHALAVAALALLVVGGKALAVVAFTARRRAERFYVGRRADGEQAVFVVGDGVARLRTPGLDWGWCSSGAHELAALLLADLLGAPADPVLAAAFCREVVARLPEDGFVVAGDELRAWVRERRTRRRARAA